MWPDFKRSLLHILFHCHINYSYPDMTELLLDIKRKLREANLGVGIQRPQQSRDARRAMADIIKAEGKKGTKFDKTETNFT